MRENKKVWVIQNRLTGKLVDADNYDDAGIWEALWCPNKASAELLRRDCDEPKNFLVRRVELRAEVVT